MFHLCQETHQRPFGEANSSNIAFEVPLALNYGGNLALHYVSIPNCVTCNKCSFVAGLTRMFPLCKEPHRINLHFLISVTHFALQPLYDGRLPKEICESHRRH